MAIAVAIAPWAGACAADTFVGADASVDAGGADASASDANSGDTTGQPSEGGSADGGATTDAAPLEAGPDSCATCTAPDLCCVYSTSQSATYACAVACSPPTGGEQLSELGCTNTADCADAGDVCCIWRSSGVNQSACLGVCSVALNQVQLCDPSSGDAGCPSADPCSTNNIQDWNLPPTFATCGGLTVP